MSTFLWGKIGYLDKRLLDGVKCLFKIKRKFKKYLFWSINGLLFPCFLLSQSNEYFFHHLTLNDGLSQTSNRYLYKDSYGFVWISSINGLNRFDGQEFKVYKYDPFDSMSLIDNNIQSDFIEDVVGNLWFTTFDGLVCYDRQHDRFESFKYVSEKGSEKIPLQEYNLLLENRANPLGVIIAQKYFRYFDIEQKIWLTNTPLDTLSGPTQRAFPVYSVDNSLKGMVCYMPDKEGIYFSSFDESGKVHHRLKFTGKENDKPELHCEDVLRAGDSLFLAANNGFVIYSLRDTTWEFIPTSGWSPTRLEHLGNNEILIASSGRGWKISPLDDLHSGNFILNEPNNPLSLASNSLNGIHLFDDGTIWSGFSMVGVDYTQPAKVKFNTLSMAELFGFGSREYSMVSMHEHESNIWCASRGGGIFVLSPELEPVNHFHTKNKGGNQLLDNGVFHIFFDNENRCWVFTFSDFGVIEKKKGVFEYSAIEKEVFLYGIELRDGRILFSGYDGGVYQLDGSDGDYDFKLIPQIDSLNPYTHMYQARNGLLFLDKNISSILILDPENDFQPAGPELPIKGEVTCYYEGPDANIIWIATKNGLIRLEPDKNWRFEIFTEEDGLPDQQIYSILGDKNNHLWLTTNRGMVRFDPESLHFHTFSLYDGLQALEYNTFSYMERSNGEFWFGGIKGINFFHPDSIKYLDILARPTLISIAINNEISPDYLVDAETKATNVSLIQKLILKHNQNDLLVKIAALEYSDPASNLFEFKMIAGEDTITRRGRKNTFEYPNMQPGNYVLYYNASNSDGIWASPKKLEIRINPPWWQTLWARTLFVLAGLGLIYAYYRYRIAQIRKEEAFKRKEAEFRQKEAEYKQLVAETETAVLRLQMNPHFIFNSMNSINSYILKKDIDTASDYLHRFATLMRMILKFAAKPLIAVSDEIELLQLYLQTEAMRFDKKFTYDFELKDDLDPDEFMIPTMILQPFVENAIWHGISGKQNGEGHIKIKFWQENESLFVSVEDNGAGRAASRETSQKAKTHESKALSITEHRLQLLEKKNGVAASFEILDLLDEAQKPAGTKVVLRFPML